jgi:hypothetical protein
MTTTPLVSPSTAPAAATVRPPARPLGTVAGRLSLAVAGIALGWLAVALTTPWILLLWLAPDVSLVRAFGDEKGVLKPSAVRRYNATHSLVGPGAVLVTGLLAWAWTPAVIAVAALWASHVLVDRGLGYGLRTADGRQRG